jgi:hypothetical protein
MNYGKLHSDFVKMCDDVKVPCNFIVCSSDTQDHLKDEAKKLNAFDKFSFKGKVPNVIDMLSTYDVFGYPLQPKHFGSCEQALGEAMLCGAVPVVLNNPSESYIVEHMETGIVAKNTDEYSRAIEYLYHNEDERKRMSKNAIVSAKKRYNIEHTGRDWNNIFQNNSDNKDNVVEFEDIEDKIKQIRNSENMIVSHDIDNVLVFEDKFKLFITEQLEKHIDLVISNEFLNSISKMGEIKEVIGKCKGMLKIKKDSILFNKTINNPKIYKESLDADQIFIYFIQNVKSDFYLSRFYTFEEEGE